MVSELLQKDASQVENWTGCTLQTVQSRGFAIDVRLSSNKMTMRLQIIKNRQERGHILLTALIMAVCLAIGVASFAVLVTSQNKSIDRSLVWNQSIPVAESGVEEALTQLFYNSTNTPPGNGWTVTN